MLKLTVPDRVAFWSILGVFVDHAPQILMDALMGDVDAERALEKSEPVYNWLKDWRIENGFWENDNEFGIPLTIENIPDDIYQGLVILVRFIGNRFNFETEEGKKHYQAVRDGIIGSEEGA